MKHLNKENINKNQVETTEQFKVLSYLKSTFKLDEIELYLYDKTTIKLIDKNKVQAYFKYNKQTKKVEFHEKIHSKNKLERWGLEKKSCPSKHWICTDAKFNMGKPPKPFL